MTTTSKVQFIRAYFEKFDCKIARLSELFDKSFRDEAFTLCVVYIDRLASGRYGRDPGKNQENFCRALRELSGTPIFAMLHPRELLERTAQRFPEALDLVKSIADKKAAGELLEEAEIVRIVEISFLDPSTKQNLIANLWRASIASVCYSRIRGPEIHGPGSGGMAFDETVYNGRKGIQVDFPLVHAALRTICERIKAISVQTGSWFGNPNYL